MKTMLSILLVIAMLISCFTMVSFTAQAAEDTTDALGKEILYTEDATSTWMRNSKAGIGNYADGTHTITYTIFNKGTTDVRAMLLLQKGWDYYNSNDGHNDRLVTVPAGGYADVSYTFTVTDGQIVGGINSSALSEATLRFDVKAVSTGLGVIPAGTELIIKYNGADDIARGIDHVTNSAMKLSDVTELPQEGKKVVSNGKVDHYLYSRLNAGVTQFVEGTHKIQFVVYNPNSYDITVNFYLQNNWSGFNESYATGEEKLLKAGTKDLFTATYTVTSGAVGTLTEPTKLYVRLDVSNSEDNQTDGIPDGVSYYVQPYNDNAVNAYNKLTSVTHYYGTDETKPSPAPSCKVSNAICPDFDFIYKTVDNGDAENGTKNWASWNGGAIELSTDTKTGNGNSIHFHKASGRWSTPTFQVQNAILQDDELMLGGEGAGTYIVTYDAKASAEFKANATIGASKQHKTAAQVAELCGGASTDYVQTYVGGGTATIGTEWNTYTSTFKISEKYIKTIQALYNAGYTNAYQLDLRFDASNGSYLTEQTTELWIDNVQISYYEESDEPVGIVYTATKAETAPHLISSTSGGIFNASNVKDGKVTFKKYVFNETNEDLQFKFILQVADGNWVTPSGGSATEFLIERNSGAWIEASVPVDADNKVKTSSGNTFDVSKLFIRFSFTGAVSVGTKLIIACSADEAAALDKSISSKNSCFSKAMTYDMKYTKYPDAEDKTVDPDFHVSGAFSSDMVLQRDRLVPVWGVAKKDIGKELTVTFGGQTKTTTVALDGTWTVTLDKMSANKNPQEMVITCNGKTQTLKNILVGDVFFVGGQSNAEKTLAACGAVYSDDYKTALIDSAEGNIRLFRQGKTDTTVDKTCWDTPQAEPVNGNYWTTESLFRANNFSAIGFFFAHKLYDAIDVPVGMVMVASGGSPLSQLMSKEASEEAEYYRYENSIPVSAMYNSLMHPFIKMSFKAMLFYQGESEMGLAKSDYGKYNEYLKIYVEDLREKNGYDFSFYNVQISSHSTEQWNGVAEQRAVQFDGIKMIDKAGLVVSMDQGFRSTDSDFAHPNYKEPVGQRLAALALNMDYNIGDANYVLSPEPVSAIKTENGILVTFKNVGDGLKRIGQHTTLSGFRAMTGPAKYVDVPATIVSKNEVLVDTTAVNGVIGVAYGVEELAFADYPEGNGDLKYVANLGNSENLPCFTFKMLAEEEKIVGAQTNVGADLTVNFHTNTQGEMKVYHNDKEITINGTFDNASGSYVYMYEGINPQCMGDKLDMELWVEGEKVDEKADYSIAEYCNNIYTAGKPAGYSDEKYNALLTLLADMLDFGAAAQKHMGYKSDSLMNTYDWIETHKTDFTAPESVKNITKTTNDSYNIKSAGLHIDNYVSIYVKFNVASWDNVAVKANGKTYTQADLKNGTLYLDDLTSTEYDKVYTIELVVDGETVQTLTYSADSYISKMYNHETAGAIIRALGRYGASAEKLATIN